LDDPTQRLAAIFYTSGTTGVPKGVECPHAGYVNLALSYADYFELVPGLDATSLTSSLGYDGSISEMYSAWVSGCAVVLLTKEQVRSGPDLLPVLRQAEVTVLFCPPVLLTTLTERPEVDLPYPLCRFVVPAGEAFPAALVEPWTRARRQVINTYGPTEASTDTSRQSLQPGEPVTIGSPLANVTYVILEVGSLRPLPHGEVGELCIAGVHLARGYRNLPELTARSFIDHPEFGRLYRTGDLCTIDTRTKRVHFLGRVDAQLKVRGHRVEIQPIEDILQTQFEEIESAVVDYQGEELVAFVAAPSLWESAASGVVPAPSQWSSRIMEVMAGQLPEPSIPTRILLVEEFARKPISGKIDRDNLPDLSALHLELGMGAHEAEPRPGDLPREAAAAEGADEVLAICREELHADLGWDDVFADHGGHSIVIARLVQRLRQAGWVVTVRDLLSDFDTPKKVSQRARNPRDVVEEPRQLTRDPTQRDEAAAAVLSVGQFTALQSLFLLALYLPALAGLVAVVSTGEIWELVPNAGLVEFVAAGLLLEALALLSPFACVLWVMVFRLFLGGLGPGVDVTPGVYPKWSRMHLRVWSMGRLQLFALRPLRLLVRSAPLKAWALRRLGARVGDNLQCAHDAELSGPLDLLVIEDNVAIQTGAYVSMSRWVGQELQIGPIHLESGCKVGLRAGIADGVRVGRGSWITPLSPVLEDVGPGEIWEGAPARCVGRCTELQRPRVSCRRSAPFWFLETSNVLMQFVLDFVLVVLPATVVTWWGSRLLLLGSPGRTASSFGVMPLPEALWNLGLFAFTTAWVTVVSISVLRCVFLRLTKFSPGLHPTRSLEGNLLLYRIKIFDQVQRRWTWTLTGQYLRALAGVRFTAIGGSECDVMLNVVPELTGAHSQVFWSHGSFTNMLDYGAEHLTLRRLDMPANFLAGNNCVAESGQFPTNFLLGVSSPASDIRFRRQMRVRLGEAIIVAGNPPLRLGSADSEPGTEGGGQPSFPLFLGRVALNDILGIGMLPITEVLAYAALFTTLLRWGGHPVVSALVALIVTEALLVASATLLKRVLVGGTWGSDHRAPFWSWRHFTYFFAQDCFLTWCKRSMRVMAGTALSNPVLRRMGCRIGRRTLLMDPLQVFDWNAVRVGDDCVVSGFLQYHTFENMVLKVKRTDIRSGSSVNFGATVMGGVVIDPETTLQPLSLVLKEARLPTDTYEGSPAQPTGSGLRIGPESKRLPPPVRHGAP
jgi:non-ribosomal peptide synthetase-like protein